jgi:hypothetical protein
MTALRAKSDALVSIKNCFVQSGDQSMGYELHRSFKVLKLACSLVVQLHCYCFFVKLFRGYATAEKLAMKLR